MFPALYKNYSYTWITILSVVLLVSCTRLPFVRQHEAPTRLFVTDYSTAWTAALEATAGQGTNIIKVQNRDTGIIETNWIDNTEHYHFLNVFSDEDFFLRARHRMQIQVHQGKKNDETAVMIRVLRTQQLEKTFLSGWEDVDSDGVEESTYLYRIGRLISIQQYNEKADDQLKSEADAD